MRALCTAAISCLLPLSAAGVEINGALLDAVRKQESRGGKVLSGDNGKSLGEYHMTAATWEMVNKRRAAEGRATFAFRPWVFCPQIARGYAADWLRALRARFSSETGREPSVAELYAYWNLGPDKFQSLGYELRRVCAAARRAALAVEAAVDAATERELKERAERLIASRPGGGQ